MTSGLLLLVRMCDIWSCLEITMQDEVNIKIDNFPFQRMEEVKSLGKT
jgi:hypothetical protein